MVKKILKGAICAALSLSMALGSVMVGASEDSKLESQNIITKSIDKKGINGDLTKAEITKFEGKQKTRGARDGDGTLPAKLVYNSKTQEEMLTQRKLTNATAKYWGGGDVNSEGSTGFYISTSKKGDLYIAFHNFVDSQLNDYQNATLTLYNTSGKQIAQVKNKNGIFLIRKLSKGTYILTIRSNNATGFSAVYPYYFTSENIGISTSSKFIVGNGSNIVQTFSISGRRQVWIDADSTGKAYIQKYSNNTWKRVSYDKKFVGTSKNLARAYYALSSGKYRLIMKPTDGALVEFAYGNKKYTGKYATKKSKAKSISRKKSKTNVLTASDAKNKSHYYKIKVTKKRNSRIDVTTWQNSGKIRVTISGKGVKTKTVNYTSSKAVKYTAKLKKGTYYIRITKMTKNTSGAYKVKYVK